MIRQVDKGFYNAFFVLWASIISVNNTQILCEVLMLIIGSHKNMPVGIHYTAQTHYSLWKYSYSMNTVVFSRNVFIIVLCKLEPLIRN